YRFLI
ncbi:uncharacterized protein TNIN_348041, partial [Trichonephila inaurata madagascariensis]